MASLFADRLSSADKSEEALKAERYQQIGQLQVELDWLKKGPDFHVGQRREWIGTQCRLTGVSLSGYYYEPEGFQQRKKKKQKEKIRGRGASVHG
jgi:hypothetical protein